MATKDITRGMADGETGGCDCDEDTRKSTRGQRMGERMPDDDMDRSRGEAEGAIDLERWIRRAEAEDAVKMAIERCEKRPARRWLQGGAAARRLAASTILTVLEMALEGVGAAQCLAAYAPRLLLARHMTVGECVRELVGEEGESALSRPHPGDPTGVWVMRVRAAVECGDLRALNRLLEEGAGGRVVTTQEKTKTIEQKFPRKWEGELDGGVLDEKKWVERWRTECGGAVTRLSPQQVVRWARVKRDKAPDVGGWSGRLVLELHAAEPAVTKALAALWSMEPTDWMSRDGVEGMWRKVKGAFVPKDVGLPRPVATPPAARRAWGARAARIVKEEASKWCETKGQFGLTGGGGQTAYPMVAGAFVRRGATVAVDDRENSYHELYRSAVFRASQCFIESLGTEKKAAVGRVLVDLIDRTFVGGSGHNEQINRTTYCFPGLPTREHDALVQGSPESPILEALVYTRASDEDGPGRVRCELHDDGWTAIMPEAAIQGLVRASHRDGSRLADGKHCVVGTRAEEAVRAGMARRHATWTMVAGVPVGDERAGLERWRERYRRKLRRIQEIATIEPHLSVVVSSRIGGPAGLATHILRSMPGHLDFWMEIDREWVDMVCDIVGVSPSAEGRRRVRKMAREMGHSFAAEVAEQRYAAGVADAAMHMGTILRRAGMVMDRAWWSALEVEQWHTDGKGWGPEVLRAAAKEFMTLNERGGGRSGGPPCMWRVWASSTPPESSRTAYPISTQDQRVALRRLMGCSVVGEVTGIPRLRSCVRCGVPAHDCRFRVGTSRGPRAQLDELGEHALTCKHGDGEFQRRHNMVATAVRECAVAAGWRANCATGQVFEVHRGRPADVWVEGHPRHRAGMAIDVTVVSTAGQEGDRTVERREHLKIEKYRAEVARHPGLGFEPFGLGLDGSVGPHAWELMREWARMQAVRRLTARNYVESLDWVVRTIAFAFVTGTLRHLRNFYDRSVKGVGKGELGLRSGWNIGDHHGIEYTTERRQGTSGTCAKIEKTFSVGCTPPSTEHERLRATRSERLTRD